MKKIVFGFLSLAVAASLNAAVYAVVDGEEINDNDVAPILRGVGAQSIEQLPADLKKQAIDRAIEVKLLIKNAYKSDIVKSEDYKKELKNATLELEKNLAFNMFQKKEFDKIKVSDEEIKAAYEKHKDMFKKPASVTASHILVKTEKEANDIIKTLKSVKADKLEAEFEKLAKEKSTEPSAKQTGGNLGEFFEGQMVKPFSDAAFSMKSKTFSQKPVKTEFGYHVIYKKDAKAAGILTLEEVKPYVQSQVAQEKFKEETAKLAKTLLEKAKVEYK